MKALALLAVLLSLTPLSSASDKPIDRSAADASQALAFDLAEHPEAEAADLYKFLHQALYGPGHAISDREAAVLWLDRELQDIGPPMEGEEPCEVLGGSPILVRVNLRPFAAGGGDGVRNAGSMRKTRRCDLVAQPSRLQNDDSVPFALAFSFVVTSMHVRRVRYKRTSTLCNNHHRRACCGWR